MQRLLLALGLILSLGSAFAAAPAKVQTFNDETAAQTQCPLDTVVWLDTRTHLYWPKRSKMYANTANGGFACLKEVRDAGNKPGEKK